MLPDRLARIVEHKRAETAQRRCELPASLLREALSAGAPAPTRSLRRALQQGTYPLIAEFKRRSPSAGALASRPLEAVEVAGAYASAGAAALSVLSDEHFFGGSLGDLRAVRSAVAIPVLRKDFILESYQLLEARLHGADAVLLIAECLEAEQLHSLCAESAVLGLEVLIEVHDPSQMDKLPADAALVGINHRDLRDFSVDIRRGPERLGALREACPNALAVAESGVESAADARYLLQAGFDALLIGSLFMRQPDPAQACADFLRELGPGLAQSRHT